jgi:hypothetical protein
VLDFDFLSLNSAVSFKIRKNITNNFASPDLASLRNALNVNDFRMFLLSLRGNGFIGLSCAHEIDSAGTRNKTKMTREIRKYWMLYHTPQFLKNALESIVNKKFEQHNCVGLSLNLINQTTNNFLSF